MGFIVFLLEDIVRLVGLLLQKIVFLKALAQLELHWGLAASF